MAFRIYTKTGDKGETALFGGRRVPKSHLRVDAYGTVDELNSFVGWLRDSLENQHIREVLAQIQHRLFTVGAHLASDPAKHPPVPDLLPSDIEILEKEMDEIDSILPPLKHFILPGGHSTVSVCHVCRTVCRRAERLAVALHGEEPVEDIVLQYLNRLSDYFFMLARQLAHDLGAEEVKWNPRGT
ncbi:MAG: cob(I)yrinic acid a,c-diamide adenosyltransferase [Saprospiraceae bacterium]|nr:cob(I)yrinic acid a,c-diamide adenosyltransferase [Saprospiraceae bacterium]